MSWFKNAIANLYGVVSAPVATTRDTLLERLGDIRGRVTNLYNRVRGRKTLKDIVEEVNSDGIEDVKHMLGREKAKHTDGLEDIKRMYGEAEARGEHEGIEEIRNLFEGEDDDDEPKLIEDGDRVKTWRNIALTKTAMATITPHIDMRVVVVYSFSYDIYQGDGGVTEYHKSKTTKGSLSSLTEIKTFIEACEMQRLDIEDVEFWSKAYLPPEQNIETPGAFEGKLIFDHVKIKIISTRELLLGCGPLPDFLRNLGIYALDGTEERVDNLCMWRSLAVYYRGDKKQHNKFATREALNLALFITRIRSSNEKTCVHQNLWIWKEYHGNSTSTSGFLNSRQTLRKHRFWSQSVQDM